MKKLIKILFSRLGITIILILVQLLLLFFSMVFFASKFVYFYLIMVVFSFGLIVAIINDDSNPTFKMAWIIPMLVFPIFGAPLYIVFGRKKVSKRIIKKLQESFETSKDIIADNTEIMNEIEETRPDIARQITYIKRTAASTIYKNTETKFLPTGEIFFENLLHELESAEKFIFLEYFIIDKGKMWDSVLEILKRKAMNGVDVRLIYDDLGTISLLEKTYPKKLESFGIKTAIFNPFRPSLDSFLNYRDHRKITVIDGNIGFAGGINLADEYINEIERHGHWKDSSVVIKGEGVSSLTAMFLQTWYFLNTDEKEDYVSYASTEKYENDGYVIPFSDSPLSGHLTGELAYMNMINNARKYVYITTPYLILDNEMLTSLRLAADCGVDVRIITPHIPDKWYVHSVTRANYTPLLKCGIKIYEYTPGFIHAKTIVADDEIAIVGTTNFDFRSFYLHFENGILMYKSKCVNEVKTEFDNILKKCTEISIDDYEADSWFNKFKGKVLKMFSPMM